MDEAAPPRTSLLKSLACWAVFIAIFIVLVVLASVDWPSNVPTYPEAPPSSNGAFMYPQDPVLVSGLGPIYWQQPLGASVEAAAHFRLGLLLLHVFWYDLAAKEFANAVAVQPGFALGYWGLAMTQKQPLWQSENTTAGVAAVLSMWSAPWPSEYSSWSDEALRSQRYIKAVSLLFEKDSTLEQRERDYSQAMMDLAADYPSDPDACAFAALSLLGMVASTGAYLTLAESDSTSATARAMLDNCTASWRTHAGLLHYTVHADDVNNLTIAAQGVMPGLRLADVATASCHAQHMTSHIFSRFGNWSQVVDANVRAVAVADGYCSRSGRGVDCDEDDHWHALEWQLYGFTQQCRFNESLAVLARMQRVARNNGYSPAYRQHLYRMWSIQTLQSQQWPGPVPLIDPPTLSMLADASPAAVFGGATIRLPPFPSVPDMLSAPLWVPHSESAALLTTAYSMAQAAGRVPSSSTLQSFRSNLDQILSRLRIMATLVAVAPDAPPYVTLYIQMVQLQAQALGQLVACTKSRDPTACSSWRGLLDQALVVERGSWGNADAPSIAIAPVCEFYGTLLTATGQDAASAQALFVECLSHLPNRLGCVLGMARTSMQLADTANATAWYSTLATQCQLGDAMWPGLREATAWNMAMNGTSS